MNRTKKRPTRLSFVESLEQRYLLTGQLVPLAVVPAVSQTETELSAQQLSPSRSCFCDWDSVITDLNNDGIPDHAFHIYMDTTTKFYISANGGYDAVGTDTEPIHPSGPRRTMDSGDVNADGWTDIVTEHYLFINQGVATDNATWLGMKSQLLPVSGQVALGDTNGDGRDNVVVRQDFQFTSFLLDDSEELIVNSTHHANDEHIVRHALGDVNQDGLADLAWVSFRDVVVMLNGGKGTWVESQRLEATSDFEEFEHDRTTIELLDVNDDGRDDIVTNYYGYFENGARVSIWKAATHAPYFDQSWSSDLKGWYEQFADFEMMDFNRDGIDDLMVAGRAGVSAMLAHSPGNFGNPTLISSPTSSGIGVHRTDLGDTLISSQFSDKTVSIELSWADSSFFTEALDKSLEGLRSRWGIRQMVGDFDGDGIPDIALVYGISENNVAVLVHFGELDGSYVIVEMELATSNFNALHVREFDANQDGFDDLGIRIYDDGVASDWVSISNGDRTFEAAVPSLIPIFPRKVSPYDFPRDTHETVFTSDESIGDLNGDGIPDVLGLSDFWEVMIAYSGESGYKVSRGVTLDGRPMKMGVRSELDYWGSLDTTILDIDLDGQNELVLMLGESIRIVERVSDTEFSLVQEIELGFIPNRNSLFPRDVTSDGIPDLIVGSWSGTSASALWLAVVPGTASGMYGKAQVASVALPFSALRAVATRGEETDFVVSRPFGFARVTYEHARVSGDYSKDGEINTADVMLLCDAVQDKSLSSEETAFFDQNDDQRIDSTDIDVWVSNVAETFRGDIDLDGDVDFADFLAISKNFGNENPNWLDGDVNCNGQVGADDFLLVQSNYGQGSSVRR